jgi:hypothetical protein
MKKLAKGAMSLTALTLTAALTAATSGLLAAEPGGRSELAPAAKVQPARLNLKQLGKILQDIGYNPKPWTTKDGKVGGYNVEFESGGWTMRFSVSPSTDGTRIWFDSTLLTLTDLAGVKPQALLSVLEQNVSIAPASVYFHKATSELRVCMWVENDALTLAQLVKHGSFFTEVTKKARTAYDQAVQSAQPAAPVPAPAPVL